MTIVSCKLDLQARKRYKLKPNTYGEVRGEIKRFDAGTELAKAEGGGGGGRLWPAAALAAGAEESRAWPLGRADEVAAAWWPRRDVDQRQPRPPHEEKIKKKKFVASGKLAAAGVWIPKRSRWAAPDSYYRDRPTAVWWPPLQKKGRMTLGFS
ncbi:hypothetical protein L484_017151 [Morus notabilis]|uniref:Uncharacterized protein n=1 Tax=Morus notabilis TaxID=981085 RepID=W9QTG7_9ROSA|nr:hypothetical protein L484_017151 [Morus notabilis]